MKIVNVGFLMMVVLTNLIATVYARYVLFQGVYDVNGNCQQSSAWIDLGFNDSISANTMKSCLEGKSWKCEINSSGGLFCYYRFVLGSCDGATNTTKKEMAQCTNGDYVVNSAVCGTKQCVARLGACEC